MRGLTVAEMAALKKCVGPLPSDEEPHEEPIFEGLEARGCVRTVEFDEEYDAWDITPRGRIALAIGVLQ